MSRYRHWIVALGIMAATPAFAPAAPPFFSLFKPKAKASEARNQAYQNQKVADRIADALRSAQLSSYDIAIEYQNGKATLTGHVADEKLKQKATEIASSVPGVKAVDNRLKVGGTTAEAAPQAIQPVGYTPEQMAGQTAKKTVAPTPAEKVVKPLAARLPKLLGSRQRPLGQSKTSESRSNQQVAEQIAEKLSRAELNGFDIEIRYQNGVAQLSGTVSDESQVRKAVEVASSVSGVQSVQNHLKVAGAGQLPNGQPEGLGRYANRDTSGGQVLPTAFQPTPPMGPPVPVAAAPAQPPAAVPQSYGHPGPGAAVAVYNTPHMPEYAWPAHAQYPNYAAVGYPKQYSASAWPYIGPFYPYPQVPLGWRQVALQWDDGAWKLNFRPRTDRWWWFLNPKNW